MATRVAQVGAYIRRTDGDLGRWLEALDWLARNEAYPTGGMQQDVVNLRYKRDFLAEDKQYDIVVLHDIFDQKIALPPAEMRKYVRSLTPAMKHSIAVSPLYPVGSSAVTEAWARRLVQTGAKHIFVFETAPNCVNGWQLGDLPGYVIRKRDTQVTIYEKEAGYATAS